MAGVFNRGLLATFNIGCPEQVWGVEFDWVFFCVCVFFPCIAIASPCRNHLSLWLERVGYVCF